MTQRMHFDFTAFYRALSATVVARDTNWKMVSEQTGVSQSTLSRMSKGRQPDAASLTALAAWSGIKPRRLHRHAPRVVPNPLPWSPSCFAKTPILTTPAQTHSKQSSRPPTTTSSVGRPSTSFRLSLS